MIVTLTDLPLNRLRRILRDTKRVFGPNDPTVQALRRAVEAKRATARKKVARA